MESNYMPKVSVITVSYQAADCITYTINSVLSQSYSHIEYIIVDGSSKDGTTAIIEQYSTKIAHYLSEPDKGIYDAMNKGLQLATGDYVLFMNAGDEFYDAGTIANTFQKTPYADIYYGQTRLIHSDRTDAGERWHIAPEQLDWKSFKKGMLVCHQAIFIRRTIVAPYDLKYRFSGDIDWIINCLKRAKTIVYTQSYICKYLVGGASKQYAIRSLTERFLIMKKHYGLLTTIVLHLLIIARFPFKK